MKLNRAIETWDKCDAGAMSIMSQAAIKYAFEDAKQDIKKLAAIQAQLVEALKGLDDSFCSINEFSTKEERHQARMSLIAARAALSAAGAQP